MVYGWDGVAILPSPLLPVPLRKRVRAGVAADICPITSYPWDGGRDGYHDMYHPIQYGGDVLEGDTSTVSYHTNTGRDTTTICSHYGCILCPVSMDMVPVSYHISYHNRYCITTYYWMEGWKEGYGTTISSVSLSCMICIMILAMYTSLPIPSYCISSCIIAWIRMDGDG